MPIHSPTAEPTGTDASPNESILKVEDRSSLNSTSSTIPPSRSRSAPDCSSRIKTAATWACTGRARRSAAIRTDRSTDPCPDTTPVIPSGGTASAAVLPSSSFRPVHHRACARSARAERACHQVFANHRFADHIAEASRRFRIPEAWIRAVLDAESGQDVGTVSSAGAWG